VKQGRLRKLGALILAGTCLTLGVNASPAQVKSVSGKLAGVVHDAAGTPQMGATVEVLTESAAVAAPLNFVTNTQGIFHGERLAPGLYTVRVTLAGFLPTLEQHVRVSAHLTTVVRIQLESLFASLDQLRRQPSPSVVEPDNWKWVLRSASVTRPVLQWMDDGNTSAGNVSIDTTPLRAKARLEFTDGSRRPGSPSNVPAAPATAFAYDQKLGDAGRMILAGQMNYLDSAAGGGLATVWLPSGALDTGSHTALVLREAKLGPGGPAFRGVRIEQGGSLALGDRLTVRYGGEYVLVGMRKAATSLRPRLELDERISDSWTAAVVFAEEPGAPTPLQAEQRDSEGALLAALNELDSFPAMLWRNGRPVLEGGWHEEVAAEHKLGAHGKLQIAAFHDDNRHVAVYGRGSDLPAGDYFQDYFSNGFAYDGGSSSSWGTRLALHERVTENLEVTTVYAFAGALSPSELAEGRLRDVLQTRPHHSFGANVSAKVHHSGTKVDAGYKWVSGTTVSRVDSYGESLFQMDPYLHVGIRQALPKFAPGHWQAMADCNNVLAQGYVSLSSQDGRSVLVPAFRTFRGGLSVQF
jgi:Carboxypeptidase regulatory-like domain